MGAEMVEWKEGSADVSAIRPSFLTHQSAISAPSRRDAPDLAARFVEDAWPMPHIGLRASPAGSTKSVSVAAMR